MSGFSQNLKNRHTFFDSQSDSDVVNLYALHYTVYK